MENESKAFSRPDTALSERAKNKSVERRQIKHLPGAGVRHVVGLLLVWVAATVTARLFLDSPVRTWVPIGFVAILLLLATRFGTLVAILGAALAAMVFAYSLFPPLGSLRVEEIAARESLSWMLLGAIVLSFLFSQPQG
jgi:K+-sensing histidine kinase KdpD